MTSPMRPCKSCGRHVRTDETTCPFCQADLGLLHALPLMPAMHDHRPAPKYGGPPFMQPVVWFPILALITAAILGAIWLLR